MTGNERVAEPSNAQDAHAGNHTALEDAGGSNIIDLNLAGHRDDCADCEHDAHNGRVTRNDDGLNQTDSRRNRRSVQNDSDNAEQEDTDGALRKGLEFLDDFALGGFDQTGSQTFTINRIVFQFHIGNERHDEGRNHAAGKRRDQPNTEQGRVAPAERFQNAAHVNHGRGNRRRRNSNLAGDDSDGKRNDRLDVLFLSDFNDNRNHRESRVARTGEDCQHIGDGRRKVVDVFRIATQDAFCNLNEIVQTAGQLHRGNSRNHRRDDQDHIPGNRTRFHAEADAQDKYAQTAGVADTHTAQTDTQEDGAEQHDNLKNQHNIHNPSRFRLVVVINSLRV